MGSLVVPRLKTHRQVTFTGSPDGVITIDLHGTPHA